MSERPLKGRNGETANRSLISRVKRAFRVRLDPAFGAATVSPESELTQGNEHNEVTFLKNFV